MFKTCPDPIDVQDLQYKLHCRLKVFDNKQLETFSKSYSLITCASRYGLLFVGSNSSNLQVIQLKCIENYSIKDKDISNYPRRNISLPSSPQHISVNCDSTILAVVTERDNCANVTFYDVLSFYKQDVSVVKEVRLSSTPGVYVKEIGWNPALPPIFTACKSDGTLGVYEIKGTSISINELPAASEATCFCWSPKGKQIAVGSKNSRITQYKPDLKAVKVVNQPPFESAHSLISLQWVSNYQFIGVYQSLEPEGTAKLVVVDAPKTGDPVYTNYEDVCYSGTSRLPQFYMMLQPHWNILMVASSNSTELGVLGSSGEAWTQWIISDSARAELPLSTDHQETLPVGLGLDISATRPLPWNESTIPPCPYLLILSHHGVLCIFNIVNLRQGVPSICTPPDAIPDLSGIQQFVTSSGDTNTPQKIEPLKVPVPGATAFQNTPASQAPLFGAKILPQPQPTYSAPEPLFGSKPAENKPLFGNQATLTPIKPLQSAAPTLFGGQTLITPVAKQQTTSMATVAPAEKYASIFSALNAPAAVQPPVENKSSTVSILNIPKPTAAAEQLVVAQPKASLVPVKEPETPKVTVNLKLKEETDILLAQMVKDDCISLESELKALLHQGKLLNINIGSEEEKVELIRKIESLQEFIKEIVDISIGENAEVHYLKQNLIQSWAWFEEARSRYNASKDETVSLLLRSQPLDSATEKKQTDIRKMMFYIESQITQASRALDEQWDNFQDYAKKVHRTKMPTMEAIFQAMVRQNGILQRQTYILKDIASRLKGRGHPTNIPSLLLSVENPGDLEESLNRLKIEHPQDIYQVQYERVLNRMRNLSETKTTKLRNLLKNRDVLHITAVKPQLSASLMLQSPESKTKRLLSNLTALATPTSPISTTAAVPKALSFVHSTPIRETKSDFKTAEIAPVAQAFKKVEVSNPPSTNSFIPLSKSASVFSNLPQEGVTPTPIATYTPSAFVPTQVNFGGASKFNFASPATAPTASAAKTVAIPTPAISVLPKFGASTLQKTSVMTVVTTSSKSALSQFNFGGGLSITPVSSTKAIIPTMTAASSASFGSGAATKPSFSFTGATHIFAAKSPATTDSSQIAVATTSGNLFGNLAQPNKAISSPTSTFGIPNTSKFSAFSAVTNASNLPVSSATVGTTPKAEEPTVTKPPIFANTVPLDSGPAKSSAPISTAPTVVIPSKPAPATEATTASLTAPTSASTVVSVTSPKTPSTPQTTSLSSASTEAPSGATLPPTATTQSLSFGASTTASVSTVPSGTSVFTVTTTTFTKPTSATTPGAGTATSTQNLFFGGNVTPNASATSSIFSSNTSSTASKPSIFGASTATSQSSIFAKPPSQQCFFGTATSPPQSGDTPPSGGIPSSSSPATTPSIFGGAQSTTPSGADTTTQSVPALDAGKTASTGQSSIFGSKATSPQTPFFGGSQSAASVTSTSTQPSFFGGSLSTTGVTTASAQPSFFGGSQSTTNGSTTTPVQPSIFGGQNVPSTVTATTQSGSIFSSNKTTSPDQQSIFGSAVVPTQSSIFGGTPASGLSTTAQATPLFGSSAVKTTASSLFLSSPTTTASSSLFGIPSTTSATKPFGGTSVSNQSSPFGGTSVTNTQQNSMFGGGANSSSTSIFGSATGTAQASIFGGAKSASTTNSSIFGGSQTSTTQNSIFGASTAPSTQPSIFGTASTTASPFTSTFGTSPFGQTSPAFGAPKTTASTFGTGFGSPTGFNATPSTTSSMFGQPAAFGNTSAPAFGTPTTAANIFGAPASTFGTNTSANVFGSPATSSASSFSFAGAANNASNAGSFGFGGLSVDNSTTNSAFGSTAPFGQTTAANPFGRTTEQKSPFGGGSSSVFGNTASSSGSIFGSNTGSTFSSNTQGGFGSSTFGSSSPFGQQATFGQSSFGNSSFGSTQPGPFSGGSGAVAQTGFGSPTSFAKPSGFGSPAVFGGSAPPAFGAAPSFGGAPAFGATPAFGSPNKIFGSNTPAAGFGSASTANSGFGNLANQNTVGFGNLAQQAASPNSTSFSGSSSFSSWR